MVIQVGCPGRRSVTPLAGVWIEIAYHGGDLSDPRSLPSRECGLKSGCQSPGVSPAQVTPLAGVWIEIICPRTVPRLPGVTPLAGVWIEIGGLHNQSRGLVVTPLAGVWIEITGTSA